MDDGGTGMIANVAEMRVVVDNTEAVERAEESRILEAVLFAADEPLDGKALAGRLPAGADVHALLLQLQQDYASRGVNLVRVGGKWSLRTAGDLAWILTRETVVTKKLSRAAIETLAIVAYHQPVTRAEVEEIRGVALSRGTLDTLLEANWIRPKGRRQTPGRPVTWVTTDAFLDHFGLESREALPGIEELKAAGLLDARSAISTLGAQAMAAVAPREDAEPGEAEEEAGSEEAETSTEFESLVAAAEATADEEEDEEGENDVDKGGEEPAKS